MITYHDQDGRPVASLWFYPDDSAKEAISMFEPVERDNGPHWFDVGDTGLLTAQYSDGNNPSSMTVGCTVKTVEDHPDDPDRWLLTMEIDEPKWE